MRSRDELLDAHQFLLELSVPSSMASDCAACLERLARRMETMPWLRLRPEGEVLIRNPRGQLVPIAGVGAVDDGARNALAQHCQDHADLGSEPFRVRGDRAGFLALPLVFEGRMLGFALLAEDGAGPPSSANPYLRSLAWVLAGSVHRHLQDEALKVREIDLESAHLETIRRLGTASEYRDQETGWHVLRMAHFAKATARALGLDAADQERILITAPMHDVGKIGIPDAILQKQGRLTPEEFGVMQTHTLIGGRILEGDDELMAAASGIAAAHHEHWDRSGYPRGIGGEDIPILARICAVVDVFDALTSSRPYKKPWNLGSAIGEIRAGSGTRFDPKVVDAFLDALPEILRIRQFFRDEIIDPNEVLALPPMAPDEGTPWDDALSVGIEAIDAHHRFLFGLVDEMEALVAARRDAGETARVMRSLDLYASIHFQAEERMMHAYGFPDVARHEELHRAFAVRLREFHEELHSNPLTAPFDILAFLRNWLVCHIRNEDTKLRALVG